MLQTAQPQLDPFTLLFTLAGLCLQMGAVAFSLARLDVRLQHGLNQWGSSMMLAAGGFALMVLRPVIPHAVSYWGGNALLLGALMLMMAAYARLFERQMPWHWAGAIALFGYAGLPLVELAGQPRRLAAFTMAAAIALLVGGSVVLLAQQLRKRRTPAGWISLAMLLSVVAAMTLRAVQMATNALADSAPTASTRPQVAALLVGAAMVTGSSIGFFFLVQDRQRREALDKALRDGLTGLYSRAGFIELAAARLRDVAASHFGLVMLDIDHFKAINDSLGHQAGDRTIAHVGRLVGERIRPTDLACRYGGEEFCLLLPDCDADAAALIAQRLVSDAAGHRVPIPGDAALIDAAGVTKSPSTGASQTVRYTLSAGSASLPVPLGGVSLGLIELAIGQADRALYAAKHGGRNRAMPASSLVEGEWPHTLAVAKGSGAQAAAPEPGPVREPPASLRPAERV